MTKTVIATDKAPAAIGPYVQATRIGNMVYTSGQIPWIRSPWISSKAASKPRPSR
jgi:enamine deaminase RidA (YjgF/YER057c/UK114 family)